MEIQTNAKKGLIFTSAVLLLYFFGDASPSHEGEVSLPYIPVTLANPRAIGWFVWILFFLYWWRYYLDGRAVWKGLMHSVQLSAAEDPFFRGYLKKMSGNTDTVKRVHRVDSVSVRFDSLFSTWKVSGIVETRIRLKENILDSVSDGDGGRENVECMFGKEYTARKLRYLAENMLTSTYFFDSVLPHTVALAAVVVWFPFLLSEWPVLTLGSLALALIIVLCRGAGLAESLLHWPAPSREENNPEGKSDAM